MMKLDQKNYFNNHPYVDFNLHFCLNPDGIIFTTIYSVKGENMKKAYLKFGEKLVEVMIDTSNSVAKEFVKHMPIVSEAHNIVGEVYFQPRCQS